MAYQINEHHFQSFEDAIRWARVTCHIDFQAPRTLSESEKQEACKGIAEWTKEPNKKYPFQEESTEWG